MNVDRASELLYLERETDAMLKELDRLHRMKNSNQETMRRLRVSLTNEERDRYEYLRAAAAVGLSA